MFIKILENMHYMTGNNKMKKSENLKNVSYNSFALSPRNDVQSVA